MCGISKWWGKLTTLPPRTQPRSGFSVRCLGALPWGLLLPAHTSTNTHALFLPAADIRPDVIVKMEPEEEEEDFRCTPDQAGAPGSLQTSESHPFLPQLRASLRSPGSLQGRFAGWLLGRRVGCGFSSQHQPKSEFCCQSLEEEQKLPGETPRGRESLAGACPVRRCGYTGAGDGGLSRPARGPVRSRKGAP